MTYAKEEASIKIEKPVEDFRDRKAAKKKKRPFDLAVSDYFKGRNLL